MLVAAACRTQAVDGNTGAAKTAAAIVRDTRCWAGLELCGRGLLRNCDAGSSCLDDDDSNTMAAAAAVAAVPPAEDRPRCQPVVAILNMVVCPGLGK